MQWLICFTTVVLYSELYFVEFNFSVFLETWICFWFSPQLMPRVVGCFCCFDFFWWGVTITRILFCSVDVDVDKPDEKSIMTYVAQFLKHYPNPHQSDGGGHQDEVPVLPFLYVRLLMFISCLVQRMTIKENAFLGLLISVNPCLQLFQTSSFIKIIYNLSSKNDCMNTVVSTSSCTFCFISF